MSKIITARLKRIVAVGFAGGMIWSLIFVLISVQVVHASTRSESIKIGPYTAGIRFSDTPPHVERPLEVMLFLSGKGGYSGRLTAEPGPGTDAAPVRTNLAADQNDVNVLKGTIRLSVRGLWHLVIDLTGPNGHGTASIDLTVSAPDAIPLWLGWLIGLSPLVGCIWLIYQQIHYRRKLTAEQHTINLL